MFDRIEVRPLPWDLLAHIKTGGRHFKTVTRKTVINYIRHKYTNYEALRREYDMDGTQTKILKHEVNLRIIELMDADPYLSQVETVYTNHKTLARIARQAEARKDYETASCVDHGRG